MYKRPNSSPSRRNTSGKKKTSQTPAGSKTSQKDALKSGQTRQYAAGEEENWKKEFLKEPVTPEDSAAIDAKLSQDDDDDDGYKAYNRKVATGVEMFELRFKKRGSLISYTFLRGSYYNFENEAEHVITLYTAMGEIHIRGRHLEALKNRLRRRSIEWMQQFYADLHERPEEGEPIITEITEPFNQEE